MLKNTPNTNEDSQPFPSRSMPGALSSAEECEGADLIATIQEHIVDDEKNAEAYTVMLNEAQQLFKEKILNMDAISKFDILLAKIRYFNKTEIAQTNVLDERISKPGPSTPSNDGNLQENKSAIVEEVTSLYPKLDLVALKSAGYNIEKLEKNTSSLFILQNLAINDSDNQNPEKKLQISINNFSQKLKNKIQELDATDPRLKFLTRLNTIFEKHKLQINEGKLQRYEANLHSALEFEPRENVKHSEKNTATIKISASKETLLADLALQNKPSSPLEAKVEKQRILAV